MTCYVSDSEHEEADYIDHTRVSPTKLLRALSGVSVNQRQLLLPRLVKYRPVLREGQWDELASRNGKSVVKSLCEDKTNGNNDFQLAKIQPSNGSRINAQNSNNNAIKNQKSNTKDDALNEEDNHNIRKYMSSFNSIPQRRGLRQRNFASTHPYMVDSIKYLGLTSVRYLNDLYAENQDIEPILKLLNHSYLKLKKKYPKDEKYKSKNFYTVLGESKRATTDQIHQDTDTQYQPDQDVNLTSSQLNSQFHDSQSHRYDIHSQGYDLGKYHDEESEYESDDSIFTPKRRRHILIEDENSDSGYSDNQRDNFMGSDSDTEMLSEPETFVRVGGKYIKEHSVLRGTLPESAKRLAFYKNGLQSNKRKHIIQKPTVKEIRKGLARKKRSTVKTKFKETFDDLIDDNPQVLVDVYNGEDDLDNMPALDTFGILSDSVSGESDNESVPSDFGEFPSLQQNRNLSTLTSLSSSEPETISNEGQEYLSDESDLVIEVDIIDRMLANTNSNLVKPDQEQGKRYRRQETHSKKTYSKTGSFSRATVAHKRRKNGKSGTTTPHPSTYGKLKLKIIKNTGKVPLEKKSTKLKKNSDPRGQNVHNREMLKSNYVFLRNPVQSNIQFEAEKEDYRQKSYKKLFQKFNQILKHTRFPSNYVLSKIDISKICSLNQGKSYVLMQDSVIVNLLDQVFTLTSVNRYESEISCEKLLSLIVKLLKDSSTSRGEKLMSEIYPGVSGLLQWFLIIQQPALEKIWRLLRIAISTLSECKDTIAGSNFVEIYPYFMLLNFILLTLHKIHSIEDREDTLDELYEQTCINYWLIFFKFFDFTNIEKVVGGVSHGSESFLIAQQLLSIENKVWSLLDSAIPRMDIPAESLLENVVSLVLITSSKSYNWNCFCTIYAGIKNQEDSFIYDRFIDAVEFLNGRFGWPIDERIILQLHSTVTSNKFGNFLDEWADPDIIDVIRTRNDIPTTSFFERFMKLLYGYISDIDPDTDKKRLSMKLFPSSHYKYEPDRKHFVMFVNRMNYILLLSQIFKEDMKNQFQKLVKSVRGLNDKNMMETAVRALSLYTEIAQQKGNSIPSESFGILFNEMFSSYLHIPRFRNLWKMLLKAFENLPDEIAVFNIFLSLEDLPDKFAPEILRVVLNFLEKSSDISVSLNQSVINQLEDNIHNILHRQMSKDLPERASDLAKSEQTIHLEIKVWIRLTSMSSSSNWEKLVLQKLPYIGNSQLREKFMLYFFNSVLLFTNLDTCKDVVITLILRNLVSFSLSPYLPEILNKLSKRNDNIVHFDKRWVPDMIITSINISGFRYNIISNILENISKDSKLHEATKTNFLNELFKNLNSEFDKKFSITWFREFCKKVLIEANKLFPKLVSVSEIFQVLANKLGILKEELDERSWSLKPLKQKLTEIHMNLTNALIFNNSECIVIRRLNNANIEVLYHLVSVYMKAICLGHSDKWKNVFYLLNFYDTQLQSYKFRVDVPNFPNFLRMLVQIPFTPDKKRLKIDKFYRLKSLISVLHIFEISLVLFSGYKDISWVRESAVQFIDASRNSCPDSTEMLDFGFSSLTPFEIFQPTRESNVNIEELADPESMEKYKNSLNESLEKLSRNCKPVLLVTSACLPLDLDFF